MRKARTKADYRGKEGELYLIVVQVCEMCRQRLLAFSGFKKKYTEAFLDDILLSLWAAKAMPNSGQRQGVKKGKRKRLMEVNADMCRRFQKLLRYMADGFAEDVWEDKRKAAGGSKYLAASRKNWLASKTMQETAIYFMGKHAAELAEGGMPDEFAVAFAEQHALFVEALLNFAMKKVTAGKETADKKVANNALYNRIQGLMRDGREIFNAEPAVQALFSYEGLRKKISGVKKTGFRIGLQEEKTLVAVKAASVWFLPTGEWFEMDVKQEGVIRAVLPAGEYRYVLTAPGYEDVEGVVVAHTGVMHRVDLVLKKAVMAPVVEKAPVEEALDEGMEMVG